MLADAWFGVAVFALLMYVALDGYDLGIGILTLGIRDTDTRRELVDLVAPAWDGNESWLILAGVALFAGFPGFYSEVLPAAYLPLIVMLIALIFRGVAIEMLVAQRSGTSKWGPAFGVGSLVATFAQGATFAAVIKGLPLNPGGHYTAGSWDFLSWYSVLGGVAAIALFVLSGTAWTAYKATGPLQALAGRIGRAAVPAVGVLVAVTAGLLPVAGYALSTSGARLVVLSWCCVVAAIALALAWWSFGRLAGARPVLAVMGAEAVGLVVILSLRAPHLAAHLTIDQAASPSTSLTFLLVGVGLIIPVILTYNGFAFWVLRGNGPLHQSAPARPAAGPAVGSIDAPIGGLL